MDQREIEIIREKGMFKVLAVPVMARQQTDQGLTAIRDVRHKRFLKFLKKLR